MRLSDFRISAWFALLLFSIAGAQSAVRVPSIISDGMVIQCGKAVELHGWADPGERVVVALGGKEASTAGKKDGTWVVTLPALKAQGPLTISIRGRNAIQIRNVLVGEVWLASGQSNMAFRFRGVQNAEAEIAAARYANLRFFQVDETFSRKPLTDLKGRWLECTPENAPDFSAVGYFFARDLHKTLNVPVGMIVSSVGGTRIETWMSARALAKDPEARQAVAKWSGVSSEEFEKIAATYRQFQHDRSAHAIAVQQARKNGTPPPPAPKQPSLRCHDCPSSLWNGMIAPLVGHPIRGFIWYQGESNTSAPARYDDLFPAMIREWRTDWKESRLPFYYVQLANYAPGGGRNSYARLRESQRRALKLPGTGMAVAIDIGQADDIHPRNKQEVGRRLALWALKENYQHDSMACSGPLFQRVSFKGNIATIEFAHCDEGLIAKGGGALAGFELAGADGKFISAQAEPAGKNKVAAHSERVPNPAYVRYAWADNPEGCNLYNSAGLPASPFTSEKDPK